MQNSGKGKTYKSVLRWDMSQCRYMYTFTPFCRSARRIPSIIDAWFNASEKTAIFSSSEGMLFPAKREPILPIAVIKAILAANPVGQRRQSYSMDFKQKTCQNFIQSRLTNTHWIDILWAYLD
ncbi:8-amino-7-oxononanoate synthase [Trifolium repens]|nr:8-amino-7-oxononanoate synthase [Trifolium repens]